MLRVFALTILTFLLFQEYNLSAQTVKNGRCGSHPTHEQKMLQSRSIPGYFGCNYINRHERTLQISLHIVVNSFGFTNITQPEIDAALVTLNENFSPCGLQFAYCTTELMLDNRFDSLDVFDYHNEEVQMTSIYYEPNTINIYLVDTIGLQGFANVAGYAAFPGGMDLMVIEKEQFNGDSTTTTHEMGHFFGLYHTFETDFGDELVDGSNCETTGDLICDTGADPDEEGHANPNDFCNYTGEVTQDLNDDWYVPPTSNFMSYYPSQCRCRFTPQQYNRMIEQYLTLRNNLW